MIATPMPSMILHQTFDQPRNALPVARLNSLSISADRDRSNRSPKPPDCPDVHEPSDTLAEVGTIDEQ
jgi:hypothetical protein